MQVKIDLTLDCANAARLATFWKLALGYEDEPPPPPFDTREEWLTHHGIPKDEWDQGAWLRDPQGLGPRLSILQVPEPKVAKNRLHMDVRVGDGGNARERWQRILEMSNRLAQAGGRILQKLPEHHVVMADPEGNEFCVAGPHS